MMRASTTRRAFTIAGLGALASTRLTVAQPATPASPVPTTGALYRVDLPAASLPAAPVAIGVVNVSMSPGTTVAYPEGSAGQSVAIDHVLTGGYDITSAGSLILVDADGSPTDIDADEPTAVASGETVVILQNEAEQLLTNGDDATTTLTVGVFSLQQGSNESTVDGELNAAVAGGSVLQSLPEAGLTITAVPADDADAITDAIAQFAVTLETGEELVVVFLPLTDSE